MMTILLLIMMIVMTMMMMMMMMIIIIIIIHINSGIRTPLEKRQYGFCMAVTFPNIYVKNSSIGYPSQCYKPLSIRFYNTEHTESLYTN